MPENAILPILMKIQDRLTAIESRLGAVETTLGEIRSEMDGQFELMMARGHKADGLEKVVAALSRRVTALEQKGR